MPAPHLGKQRADWLAANPYSDFPPGWLNPPARDVVAPADSAEARALAQRRAELDAMMNRAGDLHGKKTTHRQRREIEQRLARELRAWGFPDLADKMEHCRLAGAWAEHEHQTTADGRARLVILWDYKCGLSKLCPDESRIEQRRLVRRYVRPSKQWAGERGARRIQKGVITWPNVARGRLAEYLRAMPRETARLLAKFPAIKGAVQTIETPLSARGDWNLHNNVVLLVEGIFNWGELRAEWHRQTRDRFPECDAASFQIEITQLPRHDLKALEAALRECIKYPVKHVTEKANRRAECDTAREIPPAMSQAAAAGAAGCDAAPGADAGDDAAGGLAPAMIEWGAEAFGEWWDAHKRFRRTRSHGVLFSLAGFWWQRSKPERRAELLRQVGADPAEARSDWRALSVRGEQRAELAELVEDRDRGKVAAIPRGSLWWDARAKAYAVAFDPPRGAVDLIQGDKSPRAPPRLADKSAGIVSSDPPRSVAAG